MIPPAMPTYDLRQVTTFEKLSGDLNSYSSIRITDQWRLIFQWSSERGEARNVYLNNHSYR